MMNAVPRDGPGKDHISRASFGCSQVAGLRKRACRLHNVRDCSANTQSRGSSQLVMALMRPQIPNDDEDDLGQLLQKSEAEKGEGQEEEQDEAAGDVGLEEALSKLFPRDDARNMFISGGEISMQVRVPDRALSFNPSVEATREMPEVDAVSYMNEIRCGIFEERKCKVSLDMSHTHENATPGTPCDAAFEERTLQHHASHQEALLSVDLDSHNHAIQNTVSEIDINISAASHSLHANVSPSTSFQPAIEERQWATSSEIFTGENESNALNDFFSELDAGSDEFSSLNLGYQSQEVYSPREHVFTFLPWESMHSSCDSDYESWDFNNYLMTNENNLSESAAGNDNEDDRGQSSDGLLQNFEEEKGEGKEEEEDEAAGYVALEEALSKLFPTDNAPNMFISGGEIFMQERVPNRELFFNPSVALIMGLIENTREMPEADAVSYMNEILSGIFAKRKSRVSLDTLRTNENATAGTFSDATFMEGSLQHHASHQDAISDTFVDLDSYDHAMQNAGSKLLLT
ncbi:hypothetical protein GOP47_0028312 [Adiantum capillus-veneris]|nr:hypothetical protein GOP47_0028312 [Adiantum capillus-veneris]